MARKPTYEELEQRVKQLEKESLEHGKVEAKMALFRRFTEASGQGLGMADLEGHVIYANPTLCRFMGEDGPEDPIGKPVQTYYSAEDLPRLQNEILATVFEQGRTTAEIPLLSLKGELTPTIQNVFLIRNDDGEPVCLANVLTDITEHKRAERELKRYRDHLEELVAERTIDLRKANEKLKGEITERKLAEEAVIESEGKYRTLFDNAADLIAVIDTEGEILNLNKMFEEESGYGREEMVGKNVFASGIITKESSDRALFHLKRLLHGEELATFEVDGVKKDGGVVPYELRAAPIKKDGTVVGVQAVLRNISERKQAEKELRASKKFLHDIFDGIHDGISVLDRNLTITQVNKWIEKMHHQDMPLVGKKCYEVYQKRKSVCPWCPSLKALSTGKVHVTDVRVPSDDGSVWWCALSAYPLTDENDDVAGVIEHVTNITERKRAEEAVQESEQKYRNLVENITDVLFVADENGVITYISPPIELISGYNPSEIIGRPFREFLHRENLPIVMEQFEKVMSGHIEPVEYRIVTKSGEIRWVHSSSRLILEGDRPVGLQGMLADITERKLAERERDIRNEILQAFLMEYEEDMYDAVLKLILNAFESEFGVFGYIDQQGHLVCPSMIGDVWNRCRMPDKGIVFPENTWGDSIWGNCLRTGQSNYSNEPFHVPEGHVGINNCLVAPLVLRGKSIGLMMVVNKTDAFDESDRQLLETIANNVAPVLQARLERKRAEEERRDLEAQLRQAQKMEAIGTLAGGIAHDFNNILTPLILHTELAMSNTAEDHTRHNLRQILDAADRAKGLVKQILTFSRQSEQQIVELEPAPIIKEALKLLRSSLPTTIEMRHDIKAQSGTVMADPTHIHQVLMNLCTNAAHALREKGGVLEVTLENVEIGTDVSGEYPDVQPGPYMRLTVSDTGPGMDPAIREKIFDPFFTTKQRGEGTGMGLSVVHGIVKSYQGRIAINSELGKGTTFHVLIPRTDKEVRAETEPISPLPTGDEQILLIDDEKVILDALRLILENLSYKVTGRTSSIEALEAFKAQPDKFDLVITDMTMPNMTGKELAGELMRIRPEVPIILCTGYSEEMTKEDAKAIGIRDYVMKPIAPRDLAESVRNVLDEG